MLCFQIFIQCKLLILLPKYNGSNLSDFYRIFGKILVANMQIFLLFFTDFKLLMFHKSSVKIPEGLNK